MRTGKLALLLALSALLAASHVAGCGGSSDPFTRIESTYDGRVAALCRSCPAAAGATTEAECRTAAAANDPFSGAEFECQRAAYRMYPSELGPYYDCIARAVTGFDGCMRSAARTCPPASADITACSDAMNASIRTCPMPDSIAASQAVSACFAGP